MSSRPGRGVDEEAVATPASGSAARSRCSGAAGYAYAERSPRQVVCAVAISDHTDLSPVAQVMKELERESGATLEQAGAEVLEAPSGEQLSTGVTASGGPVYLALKRVLDIAVVIVLLALLLPLLIVISMCIYLDDHGPVLYRQTRVGRNGRLFTFYKFRSMVVDAEQAQPELAQKNEASGPIFKMRDDPRITKAGRWLRRSSMDELPQLLNVLRGDVSLVGPRPQLPKEVEQYKPHYRQRLSVQPGLLCLREVSGRSKLTFEEWMELDLLYIRQRSLRMDASIFLRAVKAVVKGDGAY